jgi:hypothetical protein
MFPPHRMLPVCNQVVSVAITEHLAPPPTYSINLCLRTTRQLESEIGSCPDDSVYALGHKSLGNNNEIISGLRTWIH